MPCLKSVMPDILKLRDRNADNLTSLFGRQLPD